MMRSLRAHTTVPQRLLAVTTSVALLVSMLPPLPVWASPPIATSISQPASGARAKGTFVYEAYQTDLFTGAATLSVPIEVPPGRRGIQPSLALGYASGSGNDWVGVGWNLNLGFIQRDTTKGVPAYTSSDPFVFSFNGTNDQLVSIGAGDYRTEVEGAFLRVQFDGVYWRVTDKSGTQYRFGFNPDARQAIPGKGVFRWALDRVEDVHGNFLTVSYTTFNNQLYPASISYTGNSQTVDSPHMTVEFLLEDRPDPIVTYRPGGLVETRKRLKQVDTKVDGALAKRYVLVYTESPDTFRSLLSSVTIIGSDGITSLPPMRFTYAQNPGIWTRNNAWNLPDGEFITSGQDQGRRLADVNGDGLTDLLVAKNSGSSWYLAAYKNTGSGWIKDTGWNLSDGNFVYADRDDGRWFAELNGDGFIDILIGNSWAGGSYKSAMVNRGSSGWTRDIHSWDIPDGYLIVGGSDGGRRLPDLNGDGLSDLVYAKDGARSTYRNTGSGWSADSRWNSPVDCVTGGVDSGARFVDLNGDGLTDLIFAKDGAKATYLNTGSGWVLDARWNVPSGDLMASGQDQGRRFADVNGDGLVDLLIAKDGSKTTYINTGSGWRQISKWTLPDGDFVAGGVDQGRWIADINGDGLVDVLIAKDGYKATYVNPFPSSDLLSQFDNGVGGTTTITYTPSTRFYNSGPLGVPNLPFPILTVASVVRDDGLGHQYTTRHDYADGLFDWQAREFRGFNRARVIDANGNYTDTFFKQDNIFKGKPYLVEMRDAAGKVYGQTFNTWQSTQPFPAVFFASLATTDQYVCNGTSTVKCDDAGGTFKLTQTDFKYDPYGNVTETMSWGEVTPTTRNTVSGDERRTQTEYAYNTTAWIMDKPSHVVTYDGNWAKAAEAWFYYDNHANFTDIPTKGLLTKEARWLNTGPSNPATTFVYDAYGNLTSATDAVGRTVSTSYDTTYRLFPVTVTNPLGHTIQSTYEPKTGVLLTQTDPNGQTMTNRYDALGRLIKVIGPNDTDVLPTVNYAYDLTTIPLRTTAQARIQSGQASVLTSYTFVDGLGRTVQTRAPAEDSTKQVVEGAVEYDTRGLVAKQWFTYLSNTAASYVPLSSEPIAATLPSLTYTYDPIGRVTKVTEPNNAITQMAYNDWVTTTLDANGNKTARTSDAYGRLGKVEEFNGTALYTTTYQYDPLNNLLQVTDAQNHISRMTYDSLSRKRSMNDPDMGAWTYAYDAVGNLTSQTDARAVTTSFTYDALNRLTQKSYTVPVGSGIANPGTVVYTYDTAVPAQLYSKGKLVKITDGSGSSSFEYDNLGRLSKESKMIDGSTYTIQRTYDLLGRLTSITYPDTEIVSYTYNPQGGMETITGLKGGVTTMYVSNINYTPAGQLTKLAEGNGVTTDYTYDPQTLRLSSLRTQNAALRTLQDMSYSFDPVGNVSAITDRVNTASQTFGYDALNRLTSASGSYGAVTYAYDPIGNMTAKEGVTMSYGLVDGTKPHAVTSTSSGLDLTYDANGNLLQKRDRTTSTTMAQLAYDAENRLTQATTGSTTSQTATVSLTTGWNFFSLPVVPSSLSIASVFGAQLASVTQVSRRNSSSNTWEHYVKNTAFNQFDTFEVGRGYAVYVTTPVTLSLTGTAASGSVSLAAGKQVLGNPTSVSRTVAQVLNNLVLGLDVTSAWRYNGTGFIALSQTDPVAVGQAIVVQLPAAKTWTLPGATSTTTQFVYDGDGGRVKVVSAAGTTKFLGSSYEIAPDGTTTKYVFAGSQRIAAKDSTGALRFYHGDHLGSSNVITDGTGAKVELAEYTPYGGLSRREGTANVPQKFTGKRLDPTGLYFYEARYYDPSLGRFITADPTIQRPGDPQDLNRYSYVRNNPVKYTDPSGHGWFKKFGAAILQTLGVLAAPFTAGASLWLTAAGTAWSGVQAAQAGQFGAWAAGFAVSALAGFALPPIPNFGNFFLQVGAEAARGAAIGAFSGGLASLAGGGSFGAGAGYGALEGASMSVAGSSARALYNKLVPFEPTWAKGGAAVEKGRGDPPVKGALNIGVSGKVNPNSLWGEGGYVSRLANYVPGINAIAGMHDMFQINLNRWGGPPLGWTLNVPGMLPAAALTYSSLLRPQGVSFIYGAGSYGAQDN